MAKKWPDTSKDGADLWQLKVNGTNAAVASIYDLSSLTEDRVAKLASAGFEQLYLGNVALFIKRDSLTPSALKIAFPNFVVAEIADDMLDTIKVETAAAFPRLDPVDNWPVELPVNLMKPPVPVVEVQRTPDVAPEPEPEAVVAAEVAEPEVVEAPAPVTEAPVEAVQDTEPTVDVPVEEKPKRAARKSAPKEPEVEAEVVDPLAEFTDDDLAMIAAAFEAGPPDEVKAEDPLGDLSSDDLAKIAVAFEGEPTVELVEPQDAVQTAVVSEQDTQAEAAAEVVVPEQVSAPAESEEAQLAVPAAPQGEAKPGDWGCIETLDVFDAYLVYEGVPTTVRLQYLEAIAEMKTLFTPEEFWSGNVAGHECNEAGGANLRKVMAKVSQRKDLARMNIVDYAHPFLCQLSRQSDAAMAEYVEFATLENRQRVDLAYSTADNAILDFERRTGIAHLQQTFRKNVRVAGMRTLSAIVEDPKSRSLMTDLEKNDVRFEALGGSRIANYRNPLISKLQKDPVALKGFLDGMEIMSPANRPQTPGM